MRLNRAKEVKIECIQESVLLASRHGAARYDQNNADAFDNYFFSAPNEVKIFIMRQKALCVMSFFRDSRTKK